MQTALIHQPVTLTHPPHLLPIAIMTIETLFDARATLDSLLYITAFSIQFFQPQLEFAREIKMNSQSQLFGANNDERGRQRVNASSSSRMAGTWRCRSWLCA
jgi:hypothetical protein